MAGEQQEIRDGTLRVRRSRDGAEAVISLGGELDVANVATVEQEVDDALRNGHGVDVVVVDMRELEFIDSTGIALLVKAKTCADGHRLRFIASESAAVGRLLEMTGISRLLEDSAAERDGG